MLSQINDTYLLQFALVYICIKHYCIAIDACLGDINLPVWTSLLHVTNIQVLKYVAHSYVFTSAINTYQ